MTTQNIQSKVLFAAQYIYLQSVQNVTLQLPSNHMIGIVGKLLNLYIFTSDLTLAIFAHFTNPVLKLHSHI